MNLKTQIVSILSIFILNSCQNQSSKQESFNEINKTEIVSINPIDELRQVDNLLLEIAEKPQKLNTPSDRKTTVIGAKGTIIHVDPNRLETVDGSPLGDNIEIELLELTDISSIILNNAQTVSNGQILITGGAYYLNMTSDGNQLKMKQGKGLAVEFPQLTEDEMGLFLGERDSLGQLNWIPSEVIFNPKNIDDTEEHKKTIKEKVIEIEANAEDSYSVDSLADSRAAPKEVNKEDVSEEEYQEYLIKVKEYQVLREEIEYQRQTYQAIELMNFGWINCDRFYNDPNPRTNIQLIINNDSLQGARIFAVFMDIRSVMSEHYYKGRKETTYFRSIPEGKELTIIALSAKDKTPYVFETTINTKTDKKVQIEFMATTEADIKEKLKRMN